MKENKGQWGGSREGSGRPKIEGGKRCTWTVPPDILEIAKTKGIPYLWEAVRIREKSI